MDDAPTPTESPAVRFLAPRWTPEEDAIILAADSAKDAHRQLIAKGYPRRTAAAIKQRQSFIHKRMGGVAPARRTPNVQAPRLAALPSEDQELMRALSRRAEVEPIIAALTAELAELEATIKRLAGRLLGNKAEDGEGGVPEHAGD